MSALVSVIIPVYNVEKYLCRCVDSVLNQSYSDLEVILVNDGSSDNCPEICDEYAERDSRVKVIHKENAGLGYARNSGIEVCSGEFVMFMDSDDYLDDDAVQVLYQRIITDNSDIAIGKHVDVYEDGSTNGRFCGFIEDRILSQSEIYSSMGKYAVSAWGKLYKREVLAGIKYPSLKCAEDLWVFPQILERCNTISIVNKTVYYYYQNSESITHKKSEQAKSDELKAILNAARFLLHRNFTENAKCYYKKGICKALFFKNCSDARHIFKNCLNCKERKQLLKGQGTKRG